jgi:60kDa lysophospholipase
LAANAGLKDQVQLLLEAGAHLHSDELAAARLQAGGSSGENKAIWTSAGIEE